MVLAQIMVFQVKVYSVTANPSPVIYSQPDGSKLTICLKGDEFIHWAQTADGYTIMPNKQGAYEYARHDSYGRLVFSCVTAHDAGKRNQSETDLLNDIPKGLFFSTEQVREMKDLLKNSGAPYAPLTGGFPTTGTRNMVLILANFSNTTTTFSQSNFSNYMNQVNYNSTGSFRDFYLEVSYGQLIINTTVTVWVTLPNPHDYYGPSSKWGQFAYDAVVAANNQTSINFANFDNNNDGVVDGVAIFHQGQGQEASANTNDIWSHSWELSSAGYTAAQRTFDGVTVDSYTTMPELLGTGMGTIGVMCHEFCHNLGAPDFYDTDYSTNGSYSGTGSWDLMAGGSWNGASGTKPAHPNAWVKASYGWTTPVVMTTPHTRILRNAQAYTDVVRFNTTTTDEYFLCENRQQTGFDVGLPGHGLIIYHVDGPYISVHSSSNDINVGSHQGLYPVCASATGNPTTTYGTINGSGCPFPGTSSKTSFTDATTPNSHSWAGANTALPLTNITENTTTKEISICFSGCTAPVNPVSFTATKYNTTQINQTWTKNASSDPVMLVYNTTNTFGTPVTGTTYAAGNAVTGGGTVLYNGANTTYSHTGLNANATYYYKAWSVGTGSNYSSGLTASASTGCTVYVPVSVTISASSYPSCAGSSVTFTATPTNGGTTPAYQWKVNGVNAGTNSATYTYVPVNNDQVTCVLTSSDPCTTGNPATSNMITMLVYPTLLQGSVSSSQSVCSNGTPAALTATAPSNGTSPVYQWQSSLDNSTFSNISGATSQSFQPGALTATTYYRQMQNATSTCGGPLPTNSVTIAVNPNLSVGTVASSQSICSGQTPALLTSTAPNGTAPVYQWQSSLDNSTFANISGATLSTYQPGALTATTYYRQMQSSTGTCGGPLATGSLTITISPSSPVSVSIAASANPVCAGVSVTFTATPVNPGASPTYSWKKGGTLISGATNSTYSYIPVNGDVITCVMTSGLACTTGSPATSFAAGERIDRRFCKSCLLRNFGDFHRYSHQWRSYPGIPVEQRRNNDHRCNEFDIQLRPG